MNKYELKCLTNLIMASDPTPLSVDEDQAIRDFADEESKKHGFEDWVDAFHALPPNPPNPPEIFPGTRKELNRIITVSKDHSND